MQILGQAARGQREVQVERRGVPWVVAAAPPGCLHPCQAQRGCPPQLLAARPHSPPHVAIGFAASRLRSHGRKDTLVNLLETGCG